VVHAIGAEARLPSADREGFLSAVRTLSELSREDRL
jgi:hypothetical protein